MMKKQRTKLITKIFDIKNGEELIKLYLKSDVVLLNDVLAKFIKVSIIEIRNTPLYCVSLPGYTWQCGLKNTDKKLQKLQKKDLISTLENNIRGGLSSNMADRYVKSDDGKKVISIDANSLYGWAMSEYLPYDEIKYDKNVFLEKNKNT